MRRSTLGAAGLMLAFSTAMQGSAEAAIFVARTNPTSYGYAEFDWNTGKLVAYDTATDGRRIIASAYISFTGQQLAYAEDSNGNNGSPGSPDYADPSDYQPGNEWITILVCRQEGTDTSTRDKCDSSDF
ncbi:hypothetical protein ABZ622_33150 [Streptomyces sp. NPDC007164]|uniref:hypothetical protein n=1 Tax=Streptomyces sp. NPDC007164 TaxID=3156918 RepID=UPI0034012570